jgi:1,4-alpha-glucan branching enzyme
MNATPVVRGGYRIGVPKEGFYTEILNTDAEIYGGSNIGNQGGAPSDPIPWQSRDHSIQIELPPLAVVGFALK